MLSELIQAVSFYVLAMWIGSSGLLLTRDLAEEHPLLAGSLGRIVGLFFWGYGYWLLRRTGWLSDTPTAWWIYTCLYSAVLTLPLIGMDRPRAWLSKHKNSLIKLECIGIGFFITGCFLRSMQPAILPAGGEKFMELALLQSVLQSVTFPPQDLWLAGEPISYYYLGYVIFGGMMKGIGLSPALGLNLAVPLVLSLCACATTGILHALVQPVMASRKTAQAYALLGSVALLLAGSQSGFMRLTGERLAEPWWWFATRIIEDRAADGQVQTIITEFPAFSFQLGDLHPHVMGLLLILFSIGWMLLLLKAPVQDRRRLGPSLVGGLVFGCAMFTNTWDAALVLALLCAPALLQLYRDRSMWPLTHLIGVAAIGFALAYPWLGHFQSQASGLVINLQHFTPLRPTALLFMPAIAVALYWAWKNRAKALEPSFPLLAAAALAGPWLIKFLEARITGQPFRSAWDSAWLIATSGGALLYWLGLLACLAALLRNVKHPASPEKLGLALLGFLGCGLLLAPEHVYLQDLFNSRMNTVFKFYFQAWILIGLTAWAMLPYVIDAAVKPRKLIGGLLLLPWLTGLLFTPMMLHARGTTYGGRTLNGAAWMRDLHPEDAHMIAWLQAHAPRDARILEAAGQAYSPAGRIAAFSGRAAWIAWPGHQHQWRGTTTYHEIVAPRAEEVQRLYQSGTAAEWRAFIETRQIDFVILGSVEIMEYRLTPDRIAALDRLLAGRAFGQSRIYQLRTAAARSHD